MSKLDPEGKLIQARIQLQKEKPFFSYLTMQLNFFESPKYKAKVKDPKMGKVAEKYIYEVDTIGVDKFGNVPYNPNFIGTGDKGLTEVQTKGVLCHEVMHCALEHLTRRLGRDPTLWNISADAVINEMLLTDGLQLPKDCVLPQGSGITLFGIKINKLRNRTSEEVYDEIYGKIKKKIGNSGGYGSGKAASDWIKKNAKGNQGFDQHIESDKHKDKAENGNSGFDGKGKDWKKILVDAASYARQRGSLPEGMDRLIGRLLETNIDWKGLLYRFITNEIPIDYVWTRPSKKSQALGIYLPSVEKEKIDVAIAIDTSGSISPKELTQFMSEVISIIKSFRNIDLTIIDCDCRINSAKTYRHAAITDALNFKLKGGGGTSHKPVYKWIKENKSATKILVAFTDGYTDFPDDPGAFRTLWVVAGSYRAKPEQFPFGEVVEMPSQNEKDDY